MMKQAVAACPSSVADHTEAIAGQQQAAGCLSCQKVIGLAALLLGLLHQLQRRWIFWTRVDRSRSLDAREVAVVVRLEVRLALIDHR